MLESICELDDELIKKYGKFAGYAYAETDKERIENLIFEIRAEIDNIYGLNTDINELFASHPINDVQNKIEEQFRSELRKAGKYQMSYISDNLFPTYFSKNVYHMNFKNRILNIKLFSFQTFLDKPSTY